MTISGTNSSMYVVSTDTKNSLVWELNISCPACHCSLPQHGDPVLQIYIFQVHAARESRAFSWRHSEERKEISYCLLHLLKYTDIKMVLCYAVCQTQQHSISTVVCVLQGCGGLPLGQLLRDLQLCRTNLKYKVLQMHEATKGKSIMS